MSYNVRLAKAWGNSLLPEEEDVAEALADYSTDDGDADETDFVSIAVLYRVYRAYVSRRPTWEGQPLAIRQFGAALRRVFPALAEPDPDFPKQDGRKVRRRINGVLTWGYWRMCGPLSIKVHCTTGRPPKNEHYVD